MNYVEKNYTFSIYVILSFTTGLLVFFVIYLQDSYSVSPSFTRQEIIDRDDDWQRFRFPSGCDLNNPIVHRLYSAPGIIAVSYYSDGKTINGTIMLSHSLKDKDSLSPTVYHMVIQPYFYYDTPSGHAGTYTDEIYFDPETEKWVRWVYEKFSNGENREIDRYVYNNTEFLDKNERFVSFSLDLDLISSPKEYLLSFATIVGTNINGERCSLKDDTYWYQIPVPRFGFFSSHNSIELRPGENKNIELKITSPLKREGDSNVNLSAKNIDELKISPHTASMNIPGEASDSIIFNIKALEDLKDEDLPITRTLIMDLKITIPDFTKQLGGLNIKSNSLTNTISESFSNLTITILNRLTFEEQFIEFWKTYGPIISLVGGGFAAGFAALVFNRFKKTKSSNDK